MSSVDGPAVKVAVWPALSALANVTFPPARMCTVAGLYLNDLIATVAVLGAAAEAAAGFSEPPQPASSEHGGEGEGEA